MSLAPELVNGLFAIGGAIGGAIVAGGFTLYAAKASRERREIVISTSTPSRLLEVDDLIASDTEITVSGKKVKNASLSEISLYNTGNKTISELEFPVSCQQKCQILSINTFKTPHENALQALVISKIDDQNYHVNVDYLNQGEVLSFRCLTTGADPSWSVGLRQPELSVIRKEVAPERYSVALLEAAITKVNDAPFGGVSFNLSTLWLKALILAVMRR